jgi:hypothetical protein
MSIAIDPLRPPATPVPGRPPRWRRMATIELDADAPDVGEVLRDLRYDFELVDLPMPPPGRRWLQLRVDASRGERRCAMTAARLLDALRRLQEIGELPHLRIFPHGEGGPHAAPYPATLARPAPACSGTACAMPT